jgi:hypothetical protein
MVSMNDWVSFNYRDFYDVPRMLILTFKDKVLLLESPFSEEKDEYPNKYAVYELPQLSEEELSGSWENLTSKALSYLGEIPVETVEFDPTRRKQINATAFDNLGI